MTRIGSNGLLSSMMVVLAVSSPVPASPGSGRAQQPSLPIAVEHAGDDRLGRLFVDRLKEALTYSGRYKLAGSPEEAELSVRVSTLDTLPRTPGEQSVAAWSLLVPKRNDAYLTGGMMSFGGKQVFDSADQLALAVDAAASRHRQAIPGASEARQAAAAWDAAVDEAAGTIASDALRKLFLQHMALQKEVFQLSGFLLPEGANLAELVGSVAAEYKDADASRRR